MSTNNLQQILKNHGIDKSVKRAAASNGHLYLYVRESVTEQERKTIEDAFWAYRKVTVV